MGEIKECIENCEKIPDGLKGSVLGVLGAEVSFPKLSLLKAWDNPVNEFCVIF